APEWIEPDFSLRSFPSRNPGQPNREVQRQPNPGTRVNDSSSGGRAAEVAHPSTARVRERILVALSGGVDSAVAALLLKQQGHDIVGAYMKNWINEDNVVGECPWQQDIVDARAVATHLGIEFRIVNLMQDYRSRVVEYL